MTGRLEKGGYHAGLSAMCDPISWTAVLRVLRSAQTNRKLRNARGMAAGSRYPSAPMDITSKTSQCLFKDSSEPVAVTRTKWLIRGAIPLR